MILLSPMKFQKTGVVRQYWKLLRCSNMQKLQSETSSSKLCIDGLV